MSNGVINVYVIIYMEIVITILFKYSYIFRSYIMIFILRSIQLHISLLIPLETTTTVEM